jgi:integrase
MDKTTAAGSPLRQRMIEDMRMRKLEPTTQTGYIRAVRKLTAYLKRSPDTATVEDLRNFQLYLVDAGTSPITLNATLTGLKFFFDITLGRGELMARMQPVKLPRTVPVVLSMQEAAALIAAARNIKHQAALSVAYGSGLRASEVCRLNVVLQRLRAWRRVGHAQGKMLPGGWLFRRHYLAAVRQLLGPSASATAVIADEAAADNAHAVTPPTFVCRHCGGSMNIVRLLAPEPAIRAPPEVVAA